MSGGAGASRRVILLAVVVLAAGATDARAEIARNFAGSAQLDYAVLPTERSGRALSFDQFTLETSLKIAVDFSKRMSANVKVCYGCHGVEVGMAFFDLRVADELNFRVGRFSPAFGDFGLRHDVANHRTSDKPLPYDMGRMLRFQDWNMGIFPVPYVDNGVEINGTRWFGDHTQLDYAVHAVTGFRGASEGVDFDYVQLRSGNLYYVDNNSQPAAGGRLALTHTFGENILLTVGGSAMHGTYDPQRSLTYTILGADLVFRPGRTTVRAEYVFRRNEIALGDDPASKFRYGPVDGRFDDFVIKDGFYVELDRPIAGPVELVARFDGLRRIGNVLESSRLRSESGVLRYTAGANVVLGRGLRIKTTGELYDFSDFEDEVVIHTSVAGSF